MHRAPSSTAGRSATTRASSAPRARQRRGRATSTAGRPSGWRRCRWCGCGCARMSSPRGRPAGTRRAAPDCAHVLHQTIGYTRPCTRHAHPKHTPCKRHASAVHTLYGTQATPHLMLYVLHEPIAAEGDLPVVRRLLLTSANLSAAPWGYARGEQLRMGQSARARHPPPRPQREPGDVCRRPAACTRLPSGAAVSRARASCGRHPAARLDAQPGRRIHVGYLLSL